MGQPVSIRAGDSKEAVRACPVTTVITGNGVDSWTHHSWKVFGTIRAFYSQWLDASPYHHVSLGREVSIVLTSNGPLVYRWESNNNGTKYYADDSEQV